MWYSVAAVVKKPLFTPLAIVVFCVGLLYSPLVHAQDTMVNVAVCGVGSGAQLTIDEPANDSVTDQPVSHISGQVSNATQIDVTIDNQYNSTIPLSTQQATYQTDLQLTPGTHTIALVANDVCQVQNANATVVVTYQPQTAPGAGTDVPTDISGGVQIGGEQPAPADSQPIGAESWPVIGPLVRLGHDIAVGLDFETRQNGGQSTLWRSMLRFSFIVVGVSTVLFGGPLIAWQSGSQTLLSTRGKWAAIAIGIMFVILAFMI